MDCNRAEDLFEPYLLGALDSGQRRLLDSHLESCAVCGPRLRESGEAVARLAFAVPQMEVPAQVKERLLARVDADVRAGPLTRAGRSLSEIWSTVIASPLPLAGSAVASVTVLGVLFGGLWFDDRLDRLGSEKDTLAAENDTLDARLQEVSEQTVTVTGQLDDMSAETASLQGELIELGADNERLRDELLDAARETSHVFDMITEQRRMTYEALRMSATPGTSVNMLWAGNTPTQTRGMIMVSSGGTQALLLVLNLPPLPADTVYQVWLINGRQALDAGVLTVDSTGFAHAVIIPVAPLSEFDGIGITVEPTGGSSGPTGANVLKGDL